MIPVIYEEIKDIEDTLFVSLPLYEDKGKDFKYRYKEVLVIRN